MAKLIGTAGHVDHGKTTLIEALTGIDADRLPEEKRRGMTIDIGFAYLDLPKHGRVSIVDVPGHERFLSNMLVGALGTDVCLLCVAADEGVMPQTREHVQIVDLLPIEHMVVALTKVDVADPEMQELVVAEIREMLAGTKFKSAPIVGVSALQRIGIEELKEALIEALGMSENARSGPWYLPIDRVFTIKGHGCIVTGTLARGRIYEGEKAVISPGNREVRIRGLQCHGEDRDGVEWGQRTAVNIAGPRLDEVHRGLTLASPGAVFESKCFDAMVRWIEVPKHAEHVRVAVGAEELVGKAFLNDAEPNVVQIRLNQVAAVALDQPIIIRRHSPPDLLGGGKVVVPVAKVRRRTEVAVIAKAKSPTEAVLEMVAAVPLGMHTEELCRRIGQSTQELGRTFEVLLEDGRLLGFAGLWMTPLAFEVNRESLLAALLKLHKESPTTPYHPRERAIHLANLGWSGKQLDRIIAHLAGMDVLEVQGTGIRLPGYRIALTDRQRAFLDRLKEELEKETVNTETIHELSKRLHVPQQAIEEIVKLGVHANELVALEGGVLYTAGQIERLKPEITRISGGKPFAISVMRDGLGTSRKFIVPLMEYMDKIGFTVRIGDNRAIR